MAKDKEKFINKAQTLLKKGQVDKAIEEYKNALEIDKKDVRLYMRLGDIYAKKKDNEKAVDNYLAAAKYLTKDGFYSRAAAVYRQILSIDDTKQDILQQLADLYTKLGLNNEAMAQYQKIATNFERDGRLKEATDVIQKMLDLDPKNVILSTKLAELNYKSGNKEGGYRAFRRALDQLQQEGRYEQYVKLLEKLAKADPDNLENLKELAQIYSEHEQWDRAFVVLARLQQNSPEDVEALNQLGDVALKAGRPDDAVKYLKALAGIYKTKGLRQRFKEALRKVLQIHPDDPEARAIVGEGEPILKEQPPPQEIEEVIEGPLEVLEEAEAEEEVLIESGPEMEEEPRKGLNADQVVEHLTEAGVYLKYGLRDKALHHIQLVLQADPDNLKAHLALKDIHLEAGKTDKAIKELEWVSRNALKTGAVNEASSAVQEWLRLEPDNAEAKKIFSETKSKAKAAPAAAPAKPPKPEVIAEAEEVIEEVEEVIEEATPIEETEIELEEDVVEEAEEPAPVIIKEAAKPEPPKPEKPEAPAKAKEKVAPVAEAAAMEVEEEEVEEIVMEEPEKKEAAVKKEAPPPAPVKVAHPKAEEEVVAVEEEEIVAEEAEEEEVVIEEEEEEAVAAEPEKPKAPPPPPTAAAAPKPPEPVKTPPKEAAAPKPKPAAAAKDFGEDLEEADFYLQQGLHDEARKVYLSILSRDPLHQISLKKIEELDQKETEEVVISEGEPVPFTGEPAPAPAPVAAKPPAPPVPPAPEPPPEPIVPEPPPPPQAREPAVPEPVAPEPPTPAVEETMSASVEPAAPDPEPEISEPAEAAPAPPVPEMQAPAPEPPAPAAVLPPEPTPPAPAAVLPPEPAPPKPAAILPPEPAPPRRPRIAAPPPPPAPAPEEKFDLRAEVEEEAPADKDFFVGPAPAPAAGLFETSSDDGGLFDLAAELEKDEELAAASGSHGLASAAEEFSFEETLQAFKKGVARTISEHDSATHYDLGIAYKEMGLHDEAIQEFLTSSRDPARYFECMLMSAMIMREKGDLDKALRTCKTALLTEGAKQNQASSLYFEMAQNLLAGGDQGRAKWSLEQARALHMDHPELNRMLSELNSVPSVAVVLEQEAAEVAAVTPPPEEEDIDIDKVFGLEPEPEAVAEEEALGEEALGEEVPEPEPVAYGVIEEPPEPAVLAQEAVESGPLPSREQTSWEKAALEQTEEPAEPAQQAEGQAPKKKRKKISYV